MTGWCGLRRPEEREDPTGTRVATGLDAGGGGIRPAAAGRVRWRQGRFRLGFAREFRGSAHIYR